MVTLPLHRLRGRQNLLTAPKRDQSCWESEEVRVVGLNQVGDGMGRKIRTSCCSISRYSDLSCPAPSIFHVTMKNHPLVVLPQSPHLRFFTLLTPLFYLCFLSSFLLTLFTVSSLCCTCPSSPCFSLPLPISLSPHPSTRFFFCR